jgi:hypothetical protein
LATADAARRRIERDLHDGARQRLVYLALTWESGLEGYENYRVALQILGRYCTMSVSRTRPPSGRRAGPGGMPGR